MLHTRKKAAVANFSAVLTATLNHAADELDSLPALVNDSVSGSDADRHAALAAMSADAAASRARLDAMNTECDPTRSVGTLLRPATRVKEVVDSILDAFEASVFERFGIPPVKCAESASVTTNTAVIPSTPTTATTTTTATPGARAAGTGTGTAALDGQKTPARHAGIGENAADARFDRLGSHGLHGSAFVHKDSGTDRDQDPIYTPVYAATGRFHATPRHDAGYEPSSSFASAGGAADASLLSAATHAMHATPQPSRRASLEFPKTPCMEDVGLDAAELRALGGLRGAGGGGGAGARVRQPEFEESPGWNDEGTDLDCAVQRSMSRLGIETPRQIDDRYHERRHLALRGVMAHVATGTDGIDLASVADGYTGEAGRGDALDGEDDSRHAR